MRLWSYLLSPLAALYGAVTRGRNYLYDSGKLRSHAFDLPVIVVGNLTVGGTGKSPMVELILEDLVQAGFSPGMISRGYGRKSSGFKLLEKGMDADQAGDEPLQIFERFEAKVPVAVCADRVMAVPELLSLHPEIDVLVLDDAYQHRRILGDCQIVLSDYARLFYQDQLMPMGRLREPIEGIRRADMVVVTKCPADLPRARQQEIRRAIQLLAQKDLPVFFAYLHYAQARPLFGSEVLAAESKIVAACGLARPQAFRSYLEDHYQLLDFFSFRDHYPYFPRDFKRLASAVRTHDAALITTEKDAVKWKSSRLAALAKELPVHVLPVKHEFFDGQEAFFKKLHTFLHA